MATDRHTELAAQAERMLDYLRMKVDARDWHGVADAAMDLREIEAQRAELDRLRAAQIRATPIDVPLHRDQTTVPQCEVWVGPHAPCVREAGHTGDHQSSDEWTMPNPRQPLTVR